MVQPLIKQKLDAKELEYNPCGIVIGKSGTGKTTLIKKICTSTDQCNTEIPNTLHEYGSYHVDCGEHKFTLIDTPSSDCSTQVYKHSMLLKECLTKEKINTIFFMIKYDGRFEKMIDEYYALESLLSKYACKIIVIISHWDQSKDPENNFHNICELFTEECPDVSNLIFYSEQSSNSEVADLLYNCISNMNGDELEITAEEFNVNFNLYEPKSSMSNLFKQYQKKANLLAEEYFKILNSPTYKFTGDKTQVLSITVDRVKCEIEELMQNYQEEHVNRMHKSDHDVLLLQMQTENSKVCNEFIDKVTQLFDNKINIQEEKANDSAYNCPQEEQSSQQNAVDTSDSENMTRNESKHRFSSPVSCYDCFFSE